MIIRQSERNDLEALLQLYTFLHDNATVPIIDDKVAALWSSIIKDPNHHIIVGIKDNQLISSCVLIIIPNLTRGQRPYALIENVVTHPDYRGNGYATQILNYAKEISCEHNCYKIMLMTGSKQESTLNFYKRAGYNMDDKTAFIQWLK